MSKAYIVVEAPTDAAILRKILPPESLQQVKFIDGEGKYGAVSMARKLLMTEHSRPHQVSDNLRGFTDRGFCEQLVLRWVVKCWSRFDAK